MTSCSARHHDRSEVRDSAQSIAYASIGLGLFATLRYLRPGPCPV